MFTIARNLPKPVSWADLGAVVDMSNQGILQQYAPPADLRHPQLPADAMTTPGIE
ncbi:hypothetical protein [Nonomuraea bangladeshensis]|uniref:hypothetical protein n=1 Tax=Nonomuraea bangladeshensis TaxID=404385 RepID=UPI003C2BC4AC